MADAGKQNFGSREQSRSIAHQRVLAAQFAEGVLHAAQIARAVIEDGNHNRPLVEGS
jgi:cobalamin biosynthesis protein CobT